MTQKGDFSPGRSRVAGFLWRKLPYVAALSLAIFGVAYTNISHLPLNGFWEFMAIAMGFVCIAAKWPSTLTGKPATGW